MFRFTFDKQLSISIKKIKVENNVAIAEAIGSGAINDYALNIMKFNFIRFCGSN